MSDDEKAIRELIRTWLEATESGDLDRILALTTDDVVFLTPGRPAFGKEAFAAASRASAGRFAIRPTGEVEEVEVRGDSAFCRTRLEVSIRPAGGGEETRVSGHTLTVYRKQPDGRWLLARDANMLAPEPRPRAVLGAVPVLQVADVAASIAWYRDVLGFSADPFGPPDAPVFAILRRDGAELMLQKSCREPAPLANGPEPPLAAYLRVADVQSLRAAAVAASAQAGPIEAREYGCREFTLIDPDGHVIVLGQCD